MIQNIGSHSYHVEYTPRAPRQGDHLLVFGKQEILGRLSEDGAMRFPSPLETKEENLQYLFRIDEEAFFLGTLPVEGYEFHSTRVLRRCSPDYLAFAGMTGWHLHLWYATHRFCGKCGRPLHHHETLRAMECSCGGLYFPVIAPAVIVGVIHEDKILITRYAGRRGAGMALVAGFCEIGETAEDTVHREVMEEAGVKVKNLRFFDTQPWGFGINLLLGYFAELDGSDEIHMDEEELQYAQWVRREDLPEQDNLASLTATMIEHFRQGNL